jgi:hypothetical protein
MAKPANEGQGSVKRGLPNILYDFNFFSRPASQPLMRRAVPNWPKIRIAA